MGRAVFPPYYSPWDKIMVDVMKILETSFKSSCPCSCTQCPWPCSRPLSTHASAGDSWTLTGKSESVFSGSLLLSPGSWFTQSSFCALQESVSLGLCKFWQLYGGVNCTIALISQASKEMLKILQARLQQYINHEPPDVQAGFRKGRGYYHMWNRSPV